MDAVTPVATPVPSLTAAARPSVALLQRLMQSRDLDVFFTTLRSFRNGVAYGTRVRAPHALVLNLVWGKGPYRDIPAKVFAVTKIHALGLGFSGALHAVVRYLLRRLQGGKAAIWHEAVAGFLVGFLFWGDPTSGVHMQMMMYMMSRMLCALYHLAASRLCVEAPRYAFRIFSGLLWALTLSMMMYAPEMIQPSMRQSLQYIFLDGAKFPSLPDLLQPIANLCKW